MARGVVVLCTVDGLTPSALAGLPKVAAALASPLQPLDAIGLEGAHYALGTGLARPDVRARAVLALEQGSLARAPEIDRLVARVESEPGTFIDFMTQEERHRCRLHLFCLSSEGGGPPAAIPAVGLCDELVNARIPFAVHLILDAPGTAGAELLDHLEAHLGDQGVIATLLGGSYVCDPGLSAERALAAHGAIVRAHEGPTSERARDALFFAGQNGLKEADLEPTRVGGYAGVTGSLIAEFGGGPAGADGGPVWEWRGNDVALLATSSAVALRPLASLLLGERLSAEVASGISMRGRAVFAFSRANLATLGGAGPLGLPCVFATGGAAPSLSKRLEAAGKRLTRVVEERVRELATFSFEGEPEGASVNATVLADAAAVLGRADDVVAEGSSDVVHVALELPSSAELGPDVDAALARLAERVSGQQGTLFLVGTGSFAALVGAPGLLEGVETHAGVSSAVLDACGVAIEDERATSRRLRRRR